VGISAQDVSCIWLMQRAGSGNSLQLRYDPANLAIVDVQTAREPVHTPHHRMAAGSSELTFRAVIGSGNLGGLRSFSAVAMSLNEFCESGQSSLNVKDK
jgi:hypothetical protein